jgi:DNA-binding transcriptional LysR family regulator
MPRPDLNLLVTLDVLLAECSVVRAARLLRLSPSAMSRALARLREATGDPLLVRAGRVLVPTPRAIELRGRVGQIVRGAEAILRPAEMLDLKRLVRTFTLRSREGFVGTFGPALIARVNQEAPGVQLRFIHKPDKDSTPLRDGTVDLETGVVGDSIGPEVRVQALCRDRFIGVVRMGHPLSDGEVTAARYAAGGHVVAASRLLDKGPIDEALRLLGLERHIVTFVGRVGAGARHRPYRHSCRTAHRQLARGAVQFPASAIDPGIHRFIALAPQTGCRRRASMVARMRQGCLRGVMRSGRIRLI